MNNSNNTTKKFTLSVGLILASFIYAYYQNEIPVSSVTTYKNNLLPVSNTISTSNIPSTSTVIPPKTKKTVVAVNVPPVSASQQPATSAAGSPTPKQTGQYKDGTYTGIAADAYYGTIQVQIIIQNGALADVQFLQYPNDRNTSVRINSRALPILKQEAISAQSANVNAVSGATDSSQAFEQSLASALSQAVNNA